MSMKMKGLLKGLRYISQIFDGEKEQEIQIGYPTDVKHVAHIGWDGQSSANSAPTWMNEFKSSTGFSTAPLGSSGIPKEDGHVKWTTEDLNGKGGLVQQCGSPARDLPELPKSSRRHSSAAATADSSLESPGKLKSEKSRQSRRPSKGSQSPARDLGDVASKTYSQTADTALGSSSPARPDIQKKTRRKKSKESSVGGSSRSSTRSKGQTTTLADESTFSNAGDEAGPLSMPKNCDPFVEDRDEKTISRIS